MPCTVYCLAPRPEQIDAVVDRVTDAGVEMGSIVVVRRRSWQLPNETRPAPLGLGSRPATTAADAAALATAAPRRSRGEGPPALADCLLPGMWFAPANWWYELTKGALSAMETMSVGPPADTATAARGGPPVPATVVSAERYAAARRRRHPR